MNAPAAAIEYQKIKAISLWQPWASLIAWGEKRYETRSWKPSMKRGDLILIHAAKRFTGEELAYCKQFPFNEVLAAHGVTDPKHQLPFGAALCVCRLGAVWSTDDFIPLRKERAFGNYSPNRFAWELEVVQVFEKPVPMAGAQGLFHVEIPKLTPPPGPLPVNGDVEAESSGDDFRADPPPPPVEIVEKSERVEAGIAELAAKRFVGLIREHCQRVEIAGSVRRKKETVKDVEIVAIAKPGLLARLDQMVGQGVITKAVYPDGKMRWGEQYRGMIFEGIKIEIFLTDADGWGYQFWLRTGPGDANTEFMRVLNARSNFRAIDGHMWHSARGWRREKDKWAADDRVMMSLPEERDFFGLIGLEFVPPAQRGVQMYQPLWKRDHAWGDATAYKKKYVRPVRVDDSRYGMLPKWHPERDYFEHNSPVMWKHSLLPIQIADFQKQIEALRGEGKDTFTLERLMEAYQARFLEGLDAIREGTMRE
jgi:hypothetical protein